MVFSYGLPIKVSKLVLPCTVLDVSTAFTTMDCGLEMVDVTSEKKTTRLLLTSLTYALCLP